MRFTEKSKTITAPSKRRLYSLQKGDRTSIFPRNPHLEPTVSPRNDNGPKSGLANIPLEIFLIIASFLDVKHILRLRRVCKSLATVTRTHSVWAVAVSQHIIQQRLPWPSWALPLSAVNTQTMEALCARTIRLLGWWDSDIPQELLRPSRCILRPENSVTWLNICFSRWLVVQLNRRVLEFWDLENELDTSPQASFDGVDGIINGGSIFHDGPDNSTLVISTRSDLAYAFELHLSAPGMPALNPHVQLTRSWTGYSELLDATHSLWGFAKSRTHQGAVILHCLSGRSVRLVGTEDDELQNLLGAIQIRHQDIAVARAHSLDLYYLDSVMSALDPEMWTATAAAIKPFQTLAYPHAWTGSGLTFIPNRPPWLRTKSTQEGDIFLSLIEDDRGFSVGLIAHNEAAGGAGEITYKFEQPYYLFGPQDHWEVAVCWGKSARRVMSVLATPEQVFLCGISIPSDGDLLEDCWPDMDRIVAQWEIPRGENDFTRHLTFDEPTGMSVIAMASGHLWIANPGATPTEFEDHVSHVNLAQICPDPAWPSKHPTPWLHGVPDRIRGEDLEDSPRWTSSVEQFYPDKNRPDCFGGATWFVNEALHIGGTAEVFFFTIPQLYPFPFTELVRLGERVLVVGRHEGKGIHEAWVLTADSTVESVKAHLRIGGTIAQLQKTSWRSMNCPPGDMLCGVIVPNPAMSSTYSLTTDLTEDCSPGFDVPTFDLILYSGFRRAWDTTPISRPDVESTANSKTYKRSLDAAGALGLTLHHLTSTTRAVGLQQIFALIPTTVARYLRFGLRILFQTLKKMP